MSNTGLNTHDVARWFIYNNPDLAHGYVDENTKLNKLLYFSSLMYYCVEKATLLDEGFVAFPNGPVVYSIYKDYRYNGLNLMPTSDDVQGIDDVQEHILNIVNFVYGNKEVQALVDESHSHNIWKNVSHLIPNNPKIDFSNIDEKMVAFYKNMFNAYNKFDFSKMKKEKINGNVIYYKDDNINMTDDVISYLLTIDRRDVPLYVELVDGEVVVS